MALDINSFRVRAGVQSGPFNINVGVSGGKASQFGGDLDDLAGFASIFQAFGIAKDADRFGDAVFDPDRIVNLLSIRDSAQSFSGFGSDRLYSDFFGEDLGLMESLVTAFVKRPDVNTGLPGFPGGGGAPSPGGSAQGGDTLAQTEAGGNKYSLGYARVTSPRYYQEAVDSNGDLSGKNEFTGPQTANVSLGTIGQLGKENIADMQKAKKYDLLLQGGERNEATGSSEAGSIGNVEQRGKENIFKARNEKESNVSQLAAAPDAVSRFEGSSDPSGRSIVVQAGDAANGNNGGKRQEVTGGRSALDVTQDAMSTEGTEQVVNAANSASLTAVSRGKKSKLDYIGSQNNDSHTIENTESEVAKADYSNDADSMVDTLKLEGADNKGTIKINGSDVVNVANLNQNKLEIDVTKGGNIDLSSLDPAKIKVTVQADGSVLLQDKTNADPNKGIVIKNTAASGTAGTIKLPSSFDPGTVDRTALPARATDTDKVNITK